MTFGASRRHLAAGAAAALGCAVAVQFVRDTYQPRATSAALEATLYVRSPAALQRIVLGFDALAADVYWIRAIQHFGGARLSTTGRRDYSLLYPFLDLATTLDPYFNIAYRFGSIFLSEAYPGGPGRPDQAIALLQKGIAGQPLKWQYYQDIGFVYYWNLRDYQAAADWFQRASNVPNAPNWLAPMAATMLTKGQDRASARFLWQEIRKSEQEWLRRAAARSLLQLDAMDAIDTLDAVVRRVSLAPGETYSWALLVRRGLLRGRPLDPTGTPFEIAADTGKVSVSPVSLLFPLPDSERPGL